MSDAGLKGATVYHNLTPAQLYEKALTNEPGTHIMCNGALATLSGELELAVELLGFVDVGEVDKQAVLFELGAWQAALLVKRLAGVRHVLSPQPCCRRQDWPQPQGQACCA